MAETPNLGDSDEASTDESRHISESLKHEDLLRPLSPERTEGIEQPEISQLSSSTEQPPISYSASVGDELSSDTNQQETNRDPFLWDEAKHDSELYDLLAERRRIEDEKQALLGKPGHELQKGLDAADELRDGVEHRIRARLVDMGLRRDTIYTRLGKQSETPPAS